MNKKTVACTHMKMLDIARWVLVIFVLATPIIPTLITPTVLGIMFSEEWEPYTVDTGSLGYKILEWIVGINPLLAALFAFFAFPSTLLILWAMAIFTGLNLMLPPETGKVEPSNFGFALRRLRDGYAWSLAANSLGLIIFFIYVSYFVFELTPYVTLIFCIIFISWLLCYTKGLRERMVAWEILGLKGAKLTLQFGFLIPFIALFFLVPFSTRFKLFDIIQPAFLAFLIPLLPSVIWGFYSFKEAGAMKRIKENLKVDLTQSRKLSMLAIPIFIASVSLSCFISPFARGIPRVELMYIMPFTYPLMFLTSSLLVVGIALLSWSCISAIKRLKRGIDVTTH